MFWQHPIDQALSRLKRSVHASLKVVLWDGREVELGDKPPRVTLRVRNRRTAAALASPSLLTLGQAYIEGDVEVEGDLRDAIRSAAEISRASSRVRVLSRRAAATPRARSWSIWSFIRAMRGEITTVTPG